MRRRGFTLAEILVSIGIFAVVGLVMMSTLFMATDIFRSGEAARQAGDEATAVLAALRDDLSRMVPLRMRDGRPATAWGWMRATADASGNCTLQVKIENPDRTAVQADGTGARLLVTWSTSGSDPATRELVRSVVPLDLNGNASGTAVSAVITRGCLHFGVWVEMSALHRPVSVVGGSPFLDWETDLPPRNGAAYDSAQAPPAAYGSSLPYWPAADALRVSLVLSGGGRYAVKGSLAQPIADATSTAFRIAGVKSLPTVDGSMLLVDEEWIRYDRFTGGQVSLSDAATQRGALRSTPGGHAVRAPVLAGQAFSLVVALPR